MREIGQCLMHHLSKVQSNNCFLLLRLYYDLALYYIYRSLRLYLPAVSEATLSKVDCLLFIGKNLRIDRFTASLLYLLLLCLMFAHDQVEYWYIATSS